MASPPEGQSAWGAGSAQEGVGVRGRCHHLTTTTPCSYRDKSENRSDDVNTVASMLFEADKRVGRFRVSHPCRGECVPLAR